MSVRTIKNVHNPAKLPFGQYSAICPQSAGSGQVRGQRGVRRRVLAALLASPAGEP
jgi:hypothetical protein